MGGGTRSGFGSDGSKIVRCGCGCGGWIVAMVAAIAFAGGGSGSVVGVAGVAGVAAVDGGGDTVADGANGGAGGDRSVAGSCSSCWDGSGLVAPWERGEGGLGVAPRTPHRCGTGDEGGYCFLLLQYKPTCIKIKQTQPKLNMHEQLQACMYNTSTCWFGLATCWFGLSTSMIHGRNPEENFFFFYLDYMFNLSVTSPTNCI